MTNDLLLKGFCTLYSLAMLAGIYSAVCWVVNIVKLIKLLLHSGLSLDNHMIIHLIGLIPGASAITAWF